MAWLGDRGGVKSFETKYIFQPGPEFFQWVSIYWPDLRLRQKNCCLRLPLGGAFAKRGSIYQRTAIIRTHSFMFLWNINFLSVCGMFEILKRKQIFFTPRWHPVHPPTSLWPYLAPSSSWTSYPPPLALLHTHKHNPLLAIPGKWVAECVWPKMFSTWFSNTYLCHQIALRQRSPLKAGYSEDKLLFSPPWNGSISSFNNRLKILPFLALNNVFHLRYEKNCGIRKKEMWIQVSSYLYFHFHNCSGTLGN